MTWLAPKLNTRIQIGTPTQEPNDAGGFDFGFDVILKIWSEFKPLSIGSFIRSRPIRGEQSDVTETHKFKVRRTAVACLGRQFTTAFDDSFDSIADLNPLKTDYYIFVQKGSAVKGRLFRIHGVVDNLEQMEYLNITAEEIEERGTGYPE